MADNSLPLVTVIVPVYNQEKYIGQCIESILAQSLQEIEIICVDDGSTDKSKEILEKYAEQECVTERLKAEDPMAWVGAMENIRSRVEEVILQELIYQ